MILITTDGRGRCNLLKVGGERNAYYFARQGRDGTIILNPARIDTVERGGSRYE